MQTIEKRMLCTRFAMFLLSSKHFALSVLSLAGRSRGWLVGGQGGSGWWWSWEELQGGSQLPGQVLKGHCRGPGHQVSRISLETTSGVSLKSYVDLVSIGAPVKSYDHISFCRISKGGGGVQFEGKETFLGKTHFLTLVSIGPRTKNQHSAVAISQIWFMWISLMTRLVQQRQHVLFK